MRERLTDALALDSVKVWTWKWPDFQDRNEHTGDVHFHTNSFAQTPFATEAKVNYSSMTCSLFSLDPVPGGYALKGKLINITVAVFFVTLPRPWSRQLASDDNIAYYSIWNLINSLSTNDGITNPNDFRDGVSCVTVIVDSGVHQRTELLSTNWRFLREWVRQCNLP